MATSNHKSYSEFGSVMRAGLTALCLTTALCTPALAGGRGGISLSVGGTVGSVGGSVGSVGGSVGGVGGAVGGIGGSVGSISSGSGGGLSVGGITIGTTGGGSRKSESANLERATRFARRREIYARRRECGVLSSFALSCFSQRCMSLSRSSMISHGQGLGRWTELSLAGPKQV